MLLPGTKWGEIIADHQPPNKVYKAMESSLKMTEKMGLGRYALMVEAQFLNFLLHHAA